jgi:hypothetical protein
MHYLLLHLDANAVNALQRDESLNELECLAALGEVDLEYSEIAYNEAGHGSSFRQAKTENYTWAGLSGQPELEADWRAKIEKAIFPLGAKTDSDRNDVEVVLTVKIAGAVLVTRDGNSKTQRRGILGSRAELAALGVMVLTFSEAVTYAKRT